jgi:hypothetical protein
LVKVRVDVAEPAEQLPKEADTVGLPQSTSEEAERVAVGVPVYVSSVVDASYLHIIVCP